MGRKITGNFTIKMALIVIFFTFTPFALITSLVSAYSIQNSASKPSQSSTQTANFQDQSGARIYASLPNSMPSFSSSIESSDSRRYLIENYLAKYNSPLKPYAKVIVETSDKYNIDWRLITAIARQESNLCKIIPPETFNCWGWGIHSRGTLGFSSFEEGIETVSKGLKTEYIDKGYKTPDEIMKKYTPSSNGSWAYGVNTFMSELE